MHRHTSKETKVIQKPSAPSVNPRRRSALRTAARIVVPVLLATGVAPVIQTAPASAKSVTVQDAEDIPTTVDVTSVTYHNREFAAGATVHVRDLHRTGSLVLRIGPVGSDIMYIATARVKADTSVGKRLEYSTIAGTETRSCNFGATWSSSQDFIRINVPHSCLKFGTFETGHWLQATMHAESHTDGVAGRDVGRGSSPGCATAAELGNIHKGYTRSRVASMLDTNGRFGDGAAGGYSRVYRNCGGGRGWFVEYNGDTNRAVGKGRVAG
jgi:hypothetical protein